MCFSGEILKASFAWTDHTDRHVEGGSQSLLSMQGQHFNKLSQRGGFYKYMKCKIVLEVETLILFRTSAEIIYITGMNYICYLIVTFQVVENGNISLSGSYIDLNEGAAPTVSQVRLVPTLTSKTCNNPHKEDL